jgi:hypothetical protein
MSDVRREGKGVKRSKVTQHMKRATQFAGASKKVHKESLRVNREFAAIEYVPNG